MQNGIPPLQEGRCWEEESLGRSSRLPASETAALYEKYESERVLESISMLSKVQHVFCFCLTGASLLHACHGSLIPRDAVLLVAPGLLIILLQMVLKFFCSSMMCRNPVMYGYVIQMVVFVFTSLSRTYAFIIMQPGVMQHRIYLIFSISMFTFYGHFCYVPHNIYMLLVALYIATWLWFHHAVDSLTIQSIEPVFFICVMVSFVRFSNNRLSWEHFQAKRVLEEEGKLLSKFSNRLQLLTSAHHKALASMFSASCVVDKKARITDASPQLPAWLGVDKSRILGCSLLDFLAVEGEKERLLVFFGAGTKFDTVAAIQTTFALPHEDQPVKNGTRLVEAKLSCVALPHEFDESSHRCFIGFDFQQSSVPGWQHKISCRSMADPRKSETVWPTVDPRISDRSWPPNTDDTRIYERPEFYSILFDAGSDACKIVGYAIETRPQETNNLLDWVVEESRDKFLNWVENTVQASPWDTCEVTPPCPECLTFSLPGRHLVDAEDCFLIVHPPNAGPGVLPVTLFVPLSDNIVEEGYQENSPRGEDALNSSEFILKVLDKVVNHREKGPNGDHNVSGGTGIRRRWQ